MRASVVVACGLRSCSSRALEHKLRDLSWSGIEPGSPALAGRFFTTEPLEKPHVLILVFAFMIRPCFLLWPLILGTACRFPVFSLPLVWPVDLAMLGFSQTVYSCALERLWESFWLRYLFWWITFPCAVLVPGHSFCGQFHRHSQ